MNFPAKCHPTLVFVPPLVYGSSKTQNTNKGNDAGERRDNDDKMWK